MSAQDLIIRSGTTDEGTWHDVFDSDKAYHLPPDGVKSIKNILDLGAYVGYTSIDFSIHFPDAHITAIEPDKDNWAVLYRNLLKYGCSRVFPVWGAFATFEGKGRLTGDSYNCKKLVCDPDGEIPVFHIDNLIGKHFDYVKMDIEGAEREILKHNTEWSNGIDCIKVELHDYLPHEAVHDLHSLGFAAWIDDVHPSCVIGIR